VTTQRANPFAIGFVVLAAAAAVVVWWGPWREHDHQHQDTKPLTDEQRRIDLVGRVARYAPASRLTSTTWPHRWSAFSGACPVWFASTRPQ
jgi:hypothetical protein